MRFITISLLIGASVAMSHLSFSVQARQLSGTEDYPFTHINSQNSGISYDGISKLMQDSRGYMWIGTFNGLNRYDGTRFTTYNRRTFGLSSDFVHSLGEDLKGNIWIGTDRGVVIYDYNLDCFLPFLQKSDLGTVIHNKVNVIRRDSEGKMWMSVNAQGLFSYDPVTGEMKNYFFKNGRQTLPVNIRRFEIDDKDEFWISLYYTNLFHADSNLSVLTQISLRPEPDYFKGDNIEGIVIDPQDDDKIYVVSVEKGLCAIDVQGEKVVNLITMPKDVVPLDLYCKKGSRYLWLPTTGGLYRYDMDSGDIELLREDKNDRFSLSDNYVFAVVTDDADGLWVGTKDGAVNYSGASQRNFRKYYSLEGMQLSDCLVSGFADDGRGTLWITTEKAGLLNLSLKSGTLSVNPLCHLTETLCAPTYEDGLLWIGSLQGLYRFNTVTGDLKLYKSFSQSSTVRDNRVFLTYQSKEGELYIGTTLGLLRYESDKDVFTSIPGFEGVFITDVDEDKKGRLWVSSYADGVFAYNMKTMKVVGHYTDDPGKELPTNKVSSMFIDSKDRIWAIGFSSGFQMYDENSNSFISFDRTTIPSLPTDIFFRAVEDDFGKLWLASDNGLVEFDPESKNVRTFTVSDGLLDNSLKNSGIKSADGDIFFGSANGFVRFNPSGFYYGKTVPNLVVTDFRIGDAKVLPGEKGSPLKCNVDITDEIALSARKNSFGFSFSILSYASNASNRIMCKLDGYDKDWREVAKDNSIYYYNVPSGSYTLLVRGTNGNDKWNIAHKTIRVRINKPLLLSPFAILTESLLFIALIVLVFVLFYRKALRIEKKKQEQYRKAKEEELFQEKMSFFSSVIHEIKTPLTLITAPLQNILSTQPSNSPISDDLSVIKNSSEYMDQLVKELLDFIRVEKHGYSLDLKPVNLIDKVNFLFFNFSDTARSKNIRISFIYDSDRLFVNADEAAVNKIFNNLIHNAVKYASSFIEIEAASSGDRAIIRFRNDGPHIPKERKEEIFRPFVQFSNDDSPYSQSFGIGLSLARSLAELHAGSLELLDDEKFTVFELILPAGDVDVRSNATELVDDPETTSSDKRSILIVEDNDSLSSYLSRNLASTYSVTTVPSAESALSLLSKDDFDLIITDIALQRMSGVELCKKITSDIELSHIPIVVTSAISSVETKIDCLQSGASMYIEKPFTLAFLKAGIKGILDRRDSLKKEIRNDVSGEIDSNKFSLVSADEAFLKKLDSAILDNLSDPDFSAKQLEVAMFLSTSTLNRKVKALLGTTPNDYLKVKRLTIAAKMLSESACRISEISYAVGFNSPSYFAKCFKEMFGELPADYQKGHNS